MSRWKSGSSELDGSILRRFELTVYVESEDVVCSTMDTMGGVEYIEGKLESFGSQSRGCSLGWPPPESFGDHVLGSCAVSIGFI